MPDASPPPKPSERDPQISKRDPASVDGKMDDPGPLCANTPPPAPAPSPPRAPPSSPNSWLRMALPARVENSCCELPVAAAVTS